MGDVLNDDKDEGYRKWLDGIINKKVLPPKIQQLIEDEKSGVTLNDIKQSYVCYAKMLHFINLNFHVHLTRGCSLLCDMHDVKDYDHYIRYLDQCGIDYRT